ncbi:MAG: hypothetical protein OEZ06_19810 [Myxococcales bacterium]|nr:hypothetical protein [Myxococcales bacterium]
MAPSQPGERLFNPHGRRHYRRRYSHTEVRIGLLILACLVAVAAWVAWAGAHPDPALFGRGLLDPGASSSSAERGPLPDELAAPGFVEGPVRHFDPDTLYEKINGRAGYFTSRGFVRLSFVSLGDQADAARAVDLELYDMGSAENALGAYSGEKPEAVEPERAVAGLRHRDQNALYLTHDRFYARAIGSDDSEAVVAQLQHLQERLQQALPGRAAALPWAHQLFQALDIGSGAIEYHRENAFSFGFARGVYVARPTPAATDAGSGDDLDETELFVVAAPGSAAAEALAARFVEGFASYGERLSAAATEPADANGSTWVQDRYLSTLATAASHGALVYGVRSAPDVPRAAAALARLAAAARALPPDTLAAAVAALEPAQAAAPAKAPLAPAAEGPESYPKPPAEDAPTAEEAGH